MTTHTYHKRACAVVLLSHTKNPILLAKQMLVRGQTDGSGSSNGGGGDPSGGAGGAQGHSVLGGPTVEKLAEEWGLQMVEEKYFWTRKRWEQHRRGLDNGVKGSGECEWNEQTEDERDREGSDGNGSGIQWSEDRGVAATSKSTSV